MKTIFKSVNALQAGLLALEQSYLSRFLIGRKIAGMFKNKVHRAIFLILWFGKTVLFYWWIL